MVSLLLLPGARDAPITLDTLDYTGAATREQRGPARSPLARSPRARPSSAAGAVSEVRAASPGLAAYRPPAEGEYLALPSQDHHAARPRSRRCPLSWRARRATRLRAP